MVPATPSGLGDVRLGSPRKFDAAGAKPSASTSVVLLKYASSTTMSFGSRCCTVICFVLKVWWRTPPGPTMEYSYGDSDGGISVSTPYRLTVSNSWRGL